MRKPPRPALTLRPEARRLKSEPHGLASESSFTSSCHTYLAMASTSTSSSAENIARRAKTAFQEAQKRLPGGKEADAARARALEKIRAALEEAKDEIKQANEKDMEVRARITDYMLPKSSADRVCSTPPTGRKRPCPTRQAIHLPRLPSRPLLQARQVGFHAPGRQRSSRSPYATRRLHLCQAPG